MRQPPLINDQQLSCPKPPGLAAHFIKVQAGRPAADVKRCLPGAGNERKPGAPLPSASYKINSPLAGSGRLKAMVKRVEAGLGKTDVITDDGAFSSLHH
ncbi:MAG: hypothetical protein H6560_06020 [Lewinellaceae bacterium]|nr:hypothetical protein [Lewinellaceae bacterium]